MGIICRRPELLGHPIVHPCDRHVKSQRRTPIAGGQIDIIIKRGSVGQRRQWGNFWSRSTARTCAPPPGTPEMRCAMRCRGQC